MKGGLGAEFGFELASVLFSILPVSFAAVAAVVQKNYKIGLSSLIDGEQLMLRSRKLLRSPFL